MNFKALAAAAALTSGMMIAGSASALSTSSCASADPNVTAYVAVSTECVLIDGGNLSTAAINAGELDGVFSTTFDWTELQRDDGADVGSVNGPNLKTVGTSNSGDWYIQNAALSSYNVFALLFKSANDNANPVPASQVIYLVSGLSGTYKNPIYNPTIPTQGPDKDPCTDAVLDECSNKGLSHLVLLGAYDPNGPIYNPSIPLPASAWLLMGAFGGVAALRRKRKA